MSRLAPGSLMQPWHADVAANSLDRWDGICRHEGWGQLPRDREMLVRVFGASWYFTRYLFVAGREAAEIIDQPTGPEGNLQNWLASLTEVAVGLDLEDGLEKLRLRKNGIMLGLLVRYLAQDLSLTELEAALTRLSEATLAALVDLLLRVNDNMTFPVTVLGMGRMAGDEMTFGSDLDLIFLYETEDQDLYNRIGRIIRQLLRTIALPSATGQLYEVDMRLRPHGNSGPLVTSYRTFMDYHAAHRDVWERQLMTRCRPVLTRSARMHEVMEELYRNLYVNYDRTLVRDEILSMRMKVEKELGSPRGRHEIKRGRGGIMDIDFLSHYLQLTHGHEYTDLRTGSTRAAIRVAASHGLIDTEQAEHLIDGYDFLKKLEMSLRLFDMKSVDSFTGSDPADRPLSRAMGFGDETEAFVTGFERVRTQVRTIFTEVLA